jgi:hypothetical protein
MSTCRIKVNLAMGSGSGSSARVESTEATKEMNAKLAAMMAERERQDKNFASVALSEKEYEAKYGGQPEAHAKK